MEIESGFVGPSAYLEFIFEADIGIIQAVIDVIAEACRGEIVYGSVGEELLFGGFKIRGTEVVSDIGIQMVKVIDDPIVFEKRVDTVVLHFLDLVYGVGGIVLQRNQSC